MVEMIVDANDGLDFGIQSLGASIFFVSCCHGYNTDKNKTSIVKKRIPITNEEDQGKSCSTVECGGVRSYTDRCYPYFSRSNGDSAMSKEKRDSIPAWT